MKKWIKNLPVALLSLALLSACGENSTGASSSGKSSSGIGTTGYTTQGESYSNIDQVRSAFNKKSLNDGIAEDTNIYHVGTYFGGNAQGGGQVSSGVYGCLNLIFWQTGDCDNSYGGYDIEQQLTSALNMGRIWTVDKIGSGSLDIGEAYDVLNNDYLFQAETFDRDNSVYRDMLGLGRSDIAQVKISNASLKLTDNTTIPATHVEFFYGTNYTGSINFTGIKRFILTKNLPVVANPVAVIDQNGYLTGYLSNIGNKINVKSITIEKMHGVYYGQVQKTSGQQTVNLR